MKEDDGGLSDVMEEPTGPYSENEDVNYKWKMKYS